MKRLKYRHKFFLVILCFLVVGICYLLPFAFGRDVGMGDYYRNVGNGYILSRSSAHQIDIVREDVTGSGDAIIPSKVVALNVYKDWVFAKRQGLKPESNERSYQVPDENVFDYRVLNTKANQVYIFSNEAQMRVFLNSQGIPQNKVLINTDEFKSMTWFQRLFLFH